MNMNELKSTSKFKAYNAISAIEVLIENRKAQRNTLIERMGNSANDFTYMFNEIVELGISIDLSEEYAAIILDEMENEGNMSGQKLSHQLNRFEKRCGPKYTTQNSTNLATVQYNIVANETADFFFNDDKGTFKSVFDILFN